MKRIAEWFAAAGAAAGTAVLGAAYAVYRVAFYQKPTTKVPSPCLLYTS